MSDWWQRRREQVHLRRAINDFQRLNDHLARDIGLNSLLLRYGLAQVHPNGREYLASLEMALESEALAPLQQRN